MNISFLPSSTFRNHVSTDSEILLSLCVLHALRGLKSGDILFQKQAFLPNKANFYSVEA